MRDAHVLGGVLAEGSIMAVAHLAPKIVVAPALAVADRIQERQREAQSEARFDRAGLDDDDIVSFEDEDGERAFIRAQHIALCCVPLDVVDKDRATMEDERDDAAEAAANSVPRLTIVD